jgi:hypothetical protein
VELTEVLTEEETESDGATEAAGELVLVFPEQLTSIVKASKETVSVFFMMICPLYEAFLRKTGFILFTE